MEDPFITSTLPTELWEIILYFATVNEAFFDIESKSNLFESPYNINPRPIHNISTCLSLKPTILAIMNVCKLWYATVSERLFNTIDIRSSEHFEGIVAIIYRIQRRSGGSDMRKYIRRLHIRPLSFHSTDLNSPDARFLHLHITNFLSNCINLEVLEDNVTWSRSMHMDAPDYFLAQVALRSCSRLRYFNWHWNNIHRARLTFAYPVQYLGCLQRLECLTTSVLGGEFSAADFNFFPRDPITLPALHTLSFISERTSRGLVKWLAACSLPSLNVVECFDSSRQNHDDEVLEMFFSTHGHTITSLKLLLVRPSTSILHHCYKSLVELTIKALHSTLLQSLTFPNIQRLGLFSDKNEPATGLAVLAEVGLADMTRFPILLLIRFFDLSSYTIQNHIQSEASAANFVVWLKVCHEQDIVVEDSMGECVSLLSV